MDEIIQSEFIIYNGQGGKPKVSVLLDEETVWLTQKQMAELFGIEISTINYHIKEIFSSNELKEKATIRKIRIVQKEGERDVSRIVDFYNLDVIISVGYRVNSLQATQFRIWATKTLREFIIKGFILDDERLKQGNQVFGKDYFEELLERIREIRASERIFFRKITDIFATSVDYDPSSKIAQDFFATVQNKLHWAIHKHTAAELICERVGAEKPNLGLNTWKKQKEKGKIIKSDVSIAKNYLKESEIKSLNRLVGMFLDFAENMAERGSLIKMKEWKEKLDDFLSFNEYEILQGTGTVSHKVAKTLADKEYEKHRKIQDLESKSDFDKFIEETKKLPSTKKEK